MFLCRTRIVLTFKNAWIVSPCFSGWLDASFTTQLFQLYRSASCTMAQTMAIRWHMRIIRIWQIWVNSCILSMLAFVGGKAYNTDCHVLLMHNFPKWILETVQPLEYFYSARVFLRKFTFFGGRGVTSLRPAVFVTSRNKGSCCNFYANFLNVNNKITGQVNGNSLCRSIPYFFASFDFKLLMAYTLARDGQLQCFVAWLVSHFCPS